MKVILLCASYGGMGEVDFPVEVEASKDGGLYLVHEKELKRIGCDMKLFRDDYDQFWPFSYDEVQVIA